MRATLREPVARDHATVLHDFEMIDRDRRAQCRAIANGLSARGQLQCIARRLALHFDSELRTVARERSSLLERGVKSLGLCTAARVEIDAIHADRSAQARVVRHRIGARAGRHAEAEVEQLVPDFRGRLVVREADDFDVVDLAERDIRGECIRDLLALGRGHRVERMHVTDEPALLVRHVGDDAVVGIRRAQRTVLIRAEIRREIAPQIQQAHVSPEARVIFLAVEDALLGRFPDAVGDLLDVREPLLLVDDEVVDRIEIFRIHLPTQRGVVVAIVAAIVVVNVQIRRRRHRRPVR